ncbi:MAG: hypothetical protein J7J76_04135 [Candidatus Latescibacteria bacterium]|nr:hypothetical protein [Candidatus Latescibacterota bacterium]
MLIEYCNNSLRVTGTSLWLDTTRRKGLPETDIFYISHAHSDHAAAHSKILASRNTARLFRQRCDQGEIITLDYNKPTVINGAQVTLFPAGHILGSSQILIETDKRVVYTGDFKMTPVDTAEKIEIKPCDVLIMECTFGKPEYFFPEREKVVQKLIDFVENTLSHRRIPVVYAYSLGKGQEVIKILGQRGYQLTVHETIYELSRVYEELGVRLGNYERFHPHSLKNKVVIMPPYARNLSWIKQLNRKRTVILTGWAVDPEAAKLWGTDLQLPLSDHADFVELIAYVLVAKHQKVYTLHGPADFAKHLRRKGIDAEHLPATRQLKLWDDL